MRLIAHTTALCLILSGTAASAHNRMFSMLDAQFEWMHHLAAAQQDTDTPAGRSSQEQARIDAFSTSAAAAGLDADLVRAFLDMRATAGEEIQSCWVARWSSAQATSPEEVKDPATSVYPALQQMDRLIFNDLLRQVPVQRDQQGDFNEHVSVDCLSDATRDRLFETLLEVQRAQ